MGKGKVVDDDQLKKDRIRVKASVIACRKTKIADTDSTGPTVCGSLRPGRTGSRKNEVTRRKRGGCFFVDRSAVIDRSGGNHCGGVADSVLWRSLDSRYYSIFHYIHEVYERELIQYIQC